MTDRGERICKLLVIVAALGTIICSGYNLQLGAIGCAVAVVVLVLLPIVIGRRA